MDIKTAPALVTERRRKTASWLALSALLFNLVAGLFVPATMVNAATPSAGKANSLSTIVVCTPNGLRTIALDDDGLPLPDQSADASFCAFCLPLTAAHANVSAQPVILDLPVAVAVRPATPVLFGNAAASVSLESRPPRAPPAFA